MKNATVIIGAGYGDEGKGLATDYFTSQAQNEPLVVRFNGGAQAGHTVVTNEGDRHVFSHFSAGSLAGAVTYLSRYFVCQPMLFRHEQAALARLGIRPLVMVDPSAPVTTPYDVAINQQLEAARGASRHGSCGVGFGETIERHEKSPFTLRARELSCARSVAERLRQIRDLYLPHRLRQLDLPLLGDEVMDDATISSFVDDARAFAASCQVTGIDRASLGREIIFEGAQGLLLDMNRGVFPHVTRSNTGLRNVVALAAESSVDSLDLVYVTRAYVTRHGAGPMAHELPLKPFQRIEDQTNLRNDWQGALRFGWLDLDILAGSIRADVSDAVGRVGSTTLLVSCMDHLDHGAYVLNGQLRSAEKSTFLQAAADTVGADTLLASFGPSRATMHVLAPHCAVA